MFDLSYSAVVCAQGEDYRVPTRNDQHDFHEVQQGLSTLGFTDQEAAVSVLCSLNEYVHTYCTLPHTNGCVCICVRLCMHTYVSLVIVSVCMCGWVGVSVYVGGCVCSVPRGW